MKLAEMLIELLLKRGLTIGGNKVDMVVDIPNSDAKMHIKIERLTVTFSDDNQNKE